MRALLAILMLCGFSADTEEMLYDTGTVQLVFRPADYKLFKDGATAKAARTPDGGKWIIVSMDAEQDDIGPLILHEMAHHLTWDAHGEDVATHGPEFQAICRKLIKKKANTYCKGKWHE